MDSFVLRHFYDHALDLPTEGQTSQPRQEERWMLVEDPIDPIQRTVEAVYEKTSRAGRIQALRRSQVTRGWAVDPETRENVFYGKACCAKTVTDETNAQLRERRRVRVPGHADDAIFCDRCASELSAEREKCKCGGVGRQNGEVTCLACGAVYKREVRLVSPK